MSTVASQNESGSGCSPKHSTCQEWLVCGAVFLWGCLLFLPSIAHEFVSWDDEANFVENTGYRGLGISQLWWMATSFHHGHYHPLTWLTIAIDYSIWGLDQHGHPDPTGIHLTNVLLHGVNGVLIYWLIRFVLDTWSSTEDRSTSGPTGRSDLYAATVGALLWAGHPLRAESVAWATERRDVLSTALLLGSLLCYFRASRITRAHGWSFFAWLLFVLSLLAKAAGIVWPVILLLIDMYLLRRLTWNWKTSWRDRSCWRIAVEKLAYLVLSVLFAWIAMRAQRSAGAWTALADHAWSERLLQATSGVGWYVIKTVWPISLSPLYPLPPTQLHLLTPGVTWTTLLSVGITATTFAWRRRYPASWIAWLLFLVLVAPVSGLAQSGPQWFADRYTYLSTVPWFVLVAGLTRALHDAARLDDTGFGWSPSAILTGFFACTLLISGWLTLDQVRIWKNSIRLWTHAASVTTYNPTAYNHLASALVKDERFEEALPLLDHALTQNPTYATAWNNRGNLRLRLGQPTEALRDFSRAVELNPTSEKYWNNQASAFGELGQFQDAKSSLDRAIELSPTFAEAYWNRFLVWVNLRDPDQAIADLKSYMKLVGALTPEKQAEAEWLLNKAAAPVDLESPAQLPKP